MPKQSLHITFIFSIRHLTAILQQGIALQQCLGALFKSKSTNKKHKKCEIHGIKKIAKMPLIGWEMNQKKQAECCLDELWWKHACQVTHIFPLPRTKKVTSSTDFGVAIKLQWGIFKWWGLSIIVLKKLTIEYLEYSV